MFDGYAFDAGALGEDSFIPAEVGVCWLLRDNQDENCRQSG